MTTGSPLRFGTVVSILRGVRMVMEDDHSTFVKYLLRDALNGRNKLQSCLPDFSDNIDHFANIARIEENYLNGTSKKPPVSLIPVHANQDSQNIHVRKLIIRPRLARVFHTTTPCTFSMISPYSPFHHTNIIQA